MIGMKCEHCGGENLHHFAVEIFHRKEDEKLGSRIFVATPGSHNQTPVGEDFRFNYEAAWPMEKESNNPSKRRHGLIVEMICEECDRITALQIAQHKGATMVSVARVHLNPE